MDYSNTFEEPKSLLELSAEQIVNTYPPNILELIHDKIESKLSTDTKRVLIRLNQYELLNKDNTYKVFNFLLDLNYFHEEELKEIAYIQNGEYNIINQEKLNKIIHLLIRQFAPALKYADYIFFDEFLNEHYGEGYDIFFESCICNKYSYIKIYVNSYTYSAFDPRTRNATPLFYGYENVLDLATEEKINANKLLYCIYRV